MLRNLFTYIVLLSVLFSFGCSKDSCTKAKGERSLSTREYINVKKVDLGISAKLLLEQDSTIKNTQLILSTESNVADRISSSNSNGVLFIRFSDCVEQHKDIQLRLKYYSLDGVIISGTGDIHSAKMIKQPKFEIDINGGGEVHLLMDVKELQTNINSTGEAYLSGIAEKHTALLNSSGDIQAFDMFSDTLNITISSSGNSRVRVRKLIDANLSARGNLFYKGNPQINSSVTGRGKIINSN